MYTNMLRFCFLELLQVGCGSMKQNIWVFTVPDAFPVAKPILSNHGRKLKELITITESH